jgi:hypothetical protein
VADLAVILVPTTSHAIRGERVLKRAGIEARLIPTPRHLSSDCGSALRISAGAREAARAALAGEGVEIDRIETLD